MSRTLSLLSLLLCACRTITPASPPPSAAWEVPITIENGIPLVEAVVGGKATLLIVDTSAPETTLQAWFVKSLEREPTDFEGHKVAELPLQLATSATTAKWRLVETVPEQRELNIGGTLCPQRLLGKGAIAIDFPRKRLMALEGSPNAWLRWLDERSPKGQVEALVRSAPFGGGLYVKTRVGDGKEVATSLASGQERSSYATALFEPALIIEGKVAGLHLRVGESEFGPLTVLTRSAETDVQGWVGMDVLQNTVLLVPVHELHPIWFMTPRE